MNGSLANEDQIQRVRRICSSLPETTEKISHGEPTWFVRKKVFAMFSNNHHNDGHVAVTLPAGIGIQAALIKASPEKFYRPPYVGVRGWIGIELSQVSDEELALHIREAWNLIAPATLQAQTKIASAKPIPADDEGFVIRPVTNKKNRKK
ncbi:MAG TPA: MmcQ/YjbR family DNA-binding protein [Pyrinomonadaceae bacterium]|nr:MmcQ/YjbR family DNA-binding protein [Pyrinomonadaceae bacterium]